MKHFIPLFILVCALTFSCEETSDDNNECPENIACTEVFVTIGVHIEDLAGNPVVLDSAKVYDGNFDLIATYHAENSDDPFLNYGFYPMASDSDLDQISFDGNPFSIRGWLKDKLVIDEAFLIGKDCCHIMKLEGVDKVIID